MISSRYGRENRIQVCIFMKFVTNIQVTNILFKINLTAVDSFQTHADIHQVLRVKLYIDFRDNAVINEEGEEERIDHRVNKLWKKGGSVHATQS